MVGASKILTVSYGTFSCTLEGFDEPFNTMTAIAEYFRDLAADDRYFGAEPPTPDAAMLHRIAEREMSRRVEARVQDNGVILRATSDAAPGTAAPHSAREASPLMFEPDEPVSLPTITESVAAKLQRLRAAAYAASPVMDAEIAASPEPVAEPVATFFNPSEFEDLGDEADETEPRLTATEDLGDAVALVAEPAAEEAAPVAEEAEVEKATAGETPADLPESEVAEPEVAEFEAVEIED